MGLVIDASEVLEIERPVGPRRADARVTQQLLHFERGLARLQDVRGERVATIYPATLGGTEASHVRA